MSDYTQRAYQAMLDAHDRGSVDFARWLTNVIAAVATKVGGTNELLAARPSSWEASKIADLMDGAGVGIPDAGHAEFAAMLEQERPARAGEVCTCGRPAVKVFISLSREEYRVRPAAEK